MNTSVLIFFKELVMRLRTKSPAFFRVIQIVFGSLTLANHIPAILWNWFNIEMPPHLINMCNDIAKYTLGIFIGAFLPAETKPVAIMEDGDLLKKTDEKTMPFTKLHEEKAKEKLAEVPTVAEVVDIKEGEESFAPEKKEE